MSVKPPWDATVTATSRLLKKKKKKINYKKQIRHKLALQRRKQQRLHDKIVEAPRAIDRVRDFVETLGSQALVSVADKLTQNAGRIVLRIEALGRHSVDRLAEVKRTNIFALRL